MRRPSMTVAEAEAALGPRGMTQINSANLLLARKWLTANGFSGKFAASLKGSEISTAYADTTDVALEALKARAAVSVAVEVAEPKADVIEEANSKIANLAAVLNPSAVKTTANQRWDDLLGNLISAGVVPNTLNRVLLYGPPRTGKSTTASLICKPVERVTLHKQQPVDDLLGGYCLRDGTTVWADGPAVRALRNGRPLVLDEIDQMSPECRFTLHALMDDPAAITLASGERVEAKDGYMVIGTTNAQPSQLPPPILDRFDLVLYCHTLSDGLKKRLGNLGNAAQRSVAPMAMWTRPSSPNLLLAATKLSGAGVGKEDVARILYPSQKREQSDFLTLLAMADKEEERG